MPCPNAPIGISCVPFPYHVIRRAFLRFQGAMPGEKGVCSSSTISCRRHYQHKSHKHEERAKQPLSYILFPEQDITIEHAHKQARPFD